MARVRKVRRSRIGHSAARRPCSTTSALPTAIHAQCRRVAGDATHPERQRSHAGCAAEAPDTSSIRCSTPRSRRILVRRPRRARSVNSSRFSNRSRILRGNRCGLAGHDTLRIARRHRRDGRLTRHRIDARRCPPELMHDFLRAEWEQALGHDHFGDGGQLLRASAAIRCGPRSCTPGSRRAPASAFLFSRCCKDATDHAGHGGRRSCHGATGLRGRGSCRRHS